MWTAAGFLSTLGCTGPSVPGVGVKTLEHSARSSDKLQVVAFVGVQGCSMPLGKAVLIMFWTALAFQRAATLGFSMAARLFLHFSLRKTFLERDLPAQQTALGPSILPTINVGILSGMRSGILPGKIRRCPLRSSAES